MPSKPKYPCSRQYLRSPEEATRIAKIEQQNVIRRTQLAVYNELASYTSRPNDEKRTAVYNGLHKTLIRWSMYAQELYDFATTLESNMKRLNLPIMWRQSTTVKDVQQYWYQTVESDDSTPNQAVLTGFTQLINQEFQDEPTPVNSVLIIEHMPIASIQAFQQAVERDITAIEQGVPLTHVTFLQNLYTNRPFYKSHKHFDPYRIGQNIVNVTGIQELLRLWASEP